MKLSFSSQPVVELATDLLAVAVFEGRGNEPPVFHELDRALDGLLSQVAAEEDFTGKDEQSLLVHCRGRLPLARLLLVGLGRREEFELPLLRRYGATAALEAQRRRCRSLALAFPPVDPSSNERSAQLIAEGVLLGGYRFDRYLGAERQTPVTLDEVLLVAPGGTSPIALARAEVVGRAVCLARDLVNEPPVELTPRKLSEVARELTKDGELECRIFGPKECEKQGMALFTAVARGSDEEPRFIHLIYRPKGREKPLRRYALIGKGVTFDSGGLSLKETAHMLDMKCDMAGAAAVLGVMGALPQLGYKSEVHGIIAATENMPSGRAYRLGDVYRSLGGATVEITNTDAEGRLTLADALAYARKLEPDEMIDVATLTGACLVALGPHIAGVMGSDSALIERFLAAARRAGEDVWHLPLPARLKEQLKSEVADLKNCGDRYGGALTAALFLREFVGSIPWLHLDVAGPAYAEKDHYHVRKGGTGFGVASLLEYLISRNGH